MAQNNLRISISNNNFRLSAGDEYYNLFDSSVTPIDAYNKLTSKFQDQKDFIADKYYLDACPRDGWMTIGNDGKITYVNDNDQLTTDTVLYPNYKRAFLSNTDDTNLSPSAVISNLIPTYKELSVITRIKETLTGTISIDNAYSTSATYNSISCDFLSVHNNIANTVFSNQISNYTGSYDVELKLSQNDAISSQDKINRTIEGFVLPNRPEIAEPFNIVHYRYMPEPSDHLNAHNNEKASMIKWVNRNDIINGNYILEKPGFWSDSFAGGWSFSGKFKQVKNEQTNYEYRPIYNLDKIITSTKLNVTGWDTDNGESMEKSATFSTPISKITFTWRGKDHNAEKTGVHIKVYNNNNTINDYLIGSGTCVVEGDGHVSDNKSEPETILLSSESKFIKVKYTSVKGRFSFGCVTATDITSKIDISNEGINEITFS